jgi:predicted O-methyltransferase YrrM
MSAGALRRSGGRAAFVVGRVLRHPSLAPEVGRKALSRATADRHRRRVSLYPRMAQDPADLLGEMLGVDAAAVERLMEEEALERLLIELAVYQPSSHTWEMGGPAFLHACYAIVRILQPRVVVETGVGHGYSTAVVLQALEENGEGMLRSVDLPVFRPGVRRHVGGAVPPRLRFSRWQLQVGPDKRVLPRLLQGLGPVNFFHYDSDKTYGGMSRTLRLVWDHLSPGGVLMVDDVDAQDAFLEFCEERALEPRVVLKPRTLSRRAGRCVGLLRRPLEEDRP